MGFEPMWLLAKRFSRPPRYDRFDTSPYLLEYSITGIYGCQYFFKKESRFNTKTALIVSSAKTKPPVLPGEIKSFSENKTAELDARRLYWRRNNLQV